MKLRHYEISRAHFQGTVQGLMCIRLPAEDRRKYGEEKVGRLVKSMHGTQDASPLWQLDSVNLISGELGGFRRGKHSAAVFNKSNEDVRMTGGVLRSGERRSSWTVPEIFLPRSGNSYEG